MEYKQQQGRRTGLQRSPYKVRTVEEVFREYKGRRTGIIKALTTDVADFIQKCDPGKENLCLYGFPNEQWEVNIPSGEVPPELPEPALGINFARDGMQQNDWLALVAVHSDAWLASVAFYLGARFCFDKAERKRLFSMINDLPTTFEVVSGIVKKQPKEKSNHSSNKSKSNTEGRGSEPQAVKYGKVEEAEVEEEEEEDDYTLCGFCGDHASGQCQFWICCDLCKMWFHGKCVKITPIKAQSIRNYKCPICSGHQRLPWLIV